jgi:hypothetical protein
MKKKLKDTPNWLRIVRRLYAYLGAGALGSMFTLYSIDTLTQNKVFFWYGVGAFTIQLICDMSFKQDPIEDLKPDPKD